MDRRFFLLACACACAPVAPQGVHAPQHVVAAPPERTVTEPAPSRAHSSVCVIPASGRGEDIELFSMEQPRRPIGTASGSVPMEWIDPDLRLAEGRVRYKDNGVFRIEGWGKATHNAGFHLIDRVMTLDGHGWVKATFNIASGSAARSGDHVRFVPPGTLLPSVAVDTPCSNLRFGYPTGEYAMYATYQGTEVKHRVIEQGFDLFATPSGAPIHAITQPRHVSVYQADGAFSYVRIDDGESVAVGWVKTSALSEPVSEPKRVSCCEEERAKPIKVRMPATESKLGTVKHLAELYVGAKPDGAAVGLVEAGLRVSLGRFDGEFVRFAPLGKNFSPPKDQSFWIRQDAIESGESSR